MLQGNRSPIGLPQSECQRQFRFRAGLQLYPAALGAGLHQIIAQLAFRLPLHG